MANNVESNFTRKLARVFMESFQDERVHSKNVNTQLLKGVFNPASGTQVDFKRPHDFKSVSTADGNITGTKRDIISGKATGTVQNYITVPVDYNEVDEALKLDQLDEVLRPAAKRIVTDLELNFTDFMVRNAGLLAGTPGTAADIWDDVADAAAMMQAHGVPMTQPWYYTVNPFTQKKLSSAQRSLGAGGEAGKLIKQAHEKATLTRNFAGFDAVMSATTLPTYTGFANADRAGTLSANPVVTYLGAKDTMTQVLTVANFPANCVITAGEPIQIAGRYRLNLATRQLIVDETGSKILFTGTVNETVTLSGTGTGTVVITGPAIYEAAGAYNTVDSAPVSGDVVTLLTGNAATVQPNLFWQKNAFAIGAVELKKLHATDTIATTLDGLQIRVSRYSDGDANKQTVRFDLLPAFSCLNPFFAGQGFGS